LKQLLNVIDASSIEEVLADREFISTGWRRQMQQRGIPFRIRLRSDRRIGDSEEGPALPARMVARPLNSGTERVLDGERYLFGEEGTPVPTRVVLRRIASGDAEFPFRVLATWKADPGEATGLDRRRSETESMFASLNLRGFDLEETNLTDPSRVERLIGLSVLAFSWTRPVGDRCTRREGSPPVKIRGCRAWSLLRYELDRPQSISTTREP
jgi:hypothetical protein